MTDERAPDLFVYDQLGGLLSLRPDLRGTFAEILLIQAKAAAKAWRWDEVRAALSELRDEHGLDIGPEVWRVVADEEVRLGLGSALRGI